MCNNPFKYNTQYRKKYGEYLFPKGSTYILGQKYWGSTFKLGNKYWGSTFSRGVLLGCYTGHCIWYTIEIWKPGHCARWKTNPVGHTWNHAGQWPMTDGYFMHCTPAPCLDPPFINFWEICKSNTQKSCIFQGLVLFSYDSILSK